MPALLRWILTSVLSQKYILLRIILSVLNKSKQASCAEMVLGSFFFMLVSFNSLVFGLRKFKQTSSTATSGAAPSTLSSVQDRAKCTLRGAGRSSRRRLLELSESKKLTVEPDER